MVKRMAPSLCPQCHTPLAEGSRFCGQCGTLTPLGKSERPPVSEDGRSPGSAVADTPKVDLTKTVVDPVPGALKGAQRTMVGYALTDEQLAAAQRARMAAWSPGAPPPAAAPAEPQSAAPRTPIVAPATGVAPASASPSSPAVSSVKRTMVGIPVGDVLGAMPPASAQAPMPNPMPAGSPASQAMDPRKGTMLGVAIPGIAPLAASAPPAMNAKGTMMGVAVPGIAPTLSDPASQGGAFGAHPPHVQPRRAVEIAPMPPPLVDDEPDVGPPPQLVKRGLPLGWVAGILGVLAAVGGVVAFFMLRSPPLVAQPKLDAQGHEILHLVCESCQDGTTAELYETRATFKNKEADLALANPLKVGNNPLTIVLDRPKLGRDESVQVVVPVAFRIRADLGDLGAPHPAITVRVEAQSGTTVKVDAKPVTLDATGDGTYSVDINSETDGPADELRMIDRVIPYAITPKEGDAQAGKLSVRVGIAPLHLDAPGLHAVVDGGSFRLTGRTLKGGTVTANGTPLKVDADGTFAQPFDIPAVGDLPIEIRSSAPQLAPRIAHLVVKRVEHLGDAAKAREAEPQASYDDVVADLKAAVGKSTIVEGDVVEARTTAMLTVAVVDDARGCSHAPCLVRVTYGGDTRFKHGDILRAYGRVTRSFPYSGSTVPEVEADFVQMGHAPKK
jgi:hypothetical protein